MKNLLFILTVFSVFSVQQATAADRAFNGSCRYVWSDNDSRLDAREMCFLSAKRDVLEKAGSYVQSISKVENGQLKKEEISAYAAALLRIEVTSERHGFKNGRNYTELRIKALIEPSEFEQLLEQSRKRNEYRKELIDRNNRIVRLEREVEMLRQNLASVSRSEAGDLRKQRRVTLQQIDHLEADKIEIVSAINTATRKAERLVEIGMTRDEVLRLMGEPRGISMISQFDDSLYAMNYGGIWVVMANQLVACLQRTPNLDHFNNCVEKNPKYDPITLVK